MGANTMIDSNEVKIYPDIQNVRKTILQLVRDNESYAQMMTVLCYTIGQMLGSTSSTEGHLLDAIDLAHESIRASATNTFVQVKEGKL
jgi:hypothetical protein